MVQVFYRAIPRENGFVIQGVQQPYEISTVTGIVEAVGIELIVSAFSNGVTDHLIMRLDQNYPEGIMYQLRT